MRARRIAFAGVATAALGIVGAPAATAAPPGCGSTLGAVETRQIVALSDTSTVGGTELEQLEDVVERNRAITEILVAHGDRRGLFAVGLDGVEEVSVMPLQRSLRFNDPVYAQTLSRDLASRWLDAVHAEFAGGVADYHWARFFELAGQCAVSPARVALAGYSAHLSVDLPRTVAAAGSEPGDAADYFAIVDAIASDGFVVSERTTAAYGPAADLGPIWRFYGAGDLADAIVGPGIGSAQLLRAADLGANVVLWNSGLALANPATRVGAEAAVRAMFDSGDIAIATLELAGGL